MNMWQTFSSYVVKVTAQPCINLWNCLNIYAAATETFCRACFLRMNLRPPAKRNGTRPSFTMLCLKWGEEEPRMFPAVDVSLMWRLWEWNMYPTICLRAICIVEYASPLNVPFCLCYHTHWEPHILFYSSSYQECLEFWNCNTFFSSFCSYISTRFTHKNPDPIRFPDQSFCQFFLIVLNIRFGLPMGCISRVWQELFRLTTLLHWSGLYTGTQWPS